MNLGGRRRDLSAPPGELEARARHVWDCMIEALGDLGTSEQLRLANSLRRGREWEDLQPGERATISELAAGLGPVGR